MEDPELGALVPYGVVLCFVSSSTVSFFLPREGGSTLDGQYNFSRFSKMFSKFEFCVDFRDGHWEVLKASNLEPDADPSCVGVLCSPPPK